MNIDPTWIFLSLIPGGLGFVLLVYGKKQSRWPQMIAGLLLMGYPYFATTAISLTVVGVLICAALWLAIRLGY